MCVLNKQFYDKTANYVSHCSTNPIQTNTNNNSSSFDDLDAIEVLNLNPNTNNNPRTMPYGSTTNKNQQNPYFYSSNQQQQHYFNNASMYHSQENLNTQAHHQQQQVQVTKKIHPVSILKRFDSSEKMYPISRPTANGSNPNGSQTTLFASQQNDFVSSQSYSFQQMNIGTIQRGGNNKQQRLIANGQHSHIDTHNDDNEAVLATANIYDKHQQTHIKTQRVNNAINTPNIQQIRQKRVQFANIPPSPATNPAQAPTSSSGKKIICFYKMS